MKTPSVEPLEKDIKKARTVVFLRERSAEAAFTPRIDCEENSNVTVCRPQSHDGRRFHPASYVAGVKQQTI
ncbi:hypothetical protein [Caballeronia arvi]|uniref:hypothetical protein n=1 Tax=Caballeronia arvi TaxID=1777135 RepID=UPI00118000F3|nr:hypothetical protein [Caballeronia arvi]